MIELFTGVVRRISLVAAIISGAALLFMSVSTLADAGLRKMFNSPIPGMIEINADIMVVTVFLALSMTQIMKSHIQITMVLNRLPARIKAPVTVIGLALAFAFFLVLGVETWKDFLYSVRIGQYHMGTGINIPMWPAKLAIPVGCFIICLQLVVDMALTIFPKAVRTRPVAKAEGLGM